MCCFSVIAEYNVDFVSLKGREGDIHVGYTYIYVYKLQNAATTSNNYTTSRCNNNNKPHMSSSVQNSYQTSSLKAEKHTY